MKKIFLGFDKSRKVSGGTKLILRTQPPAGDALAYGPADDPGHFLGYVVGVLSLPRWMSSTFAKALAAKVDLTRYSDDWIEKVVYVPANGKPLTSDEKKLITTLCDFFPCLEHPMDQGCAGASPLTTLQPVRLGSDRKLTIEPPDPKPFYALVSASDPNDRTLITEVTVAAQSDRKRFEKSALHQHVVSEHALRRHRPRHPRAGLLNAIRALPADFVP